MTPRHSVTPDFAQLKALAHPVRLRMLGMLRVDGPATASQLAVRLGLNSGATSYHLRQLAECGLIEDDPQRGTKRDRWWRAAHESTQTGPPSSEDERIVQESYLDVVFGQNSRMLADAAQERRELPPEWAQIVDASDWVMRLTPAQAKSATGRIHALLAQLAAEELPESDAVEGVEQVVFMFHAFPYPGRVTTPLEQR